MNTMAPTRPAELGFYRTPAGKAVYFTFTLQSGLVKGGGRGSG